jgi:hypothetical protein
MELSEMFLLGWAFGATVVAGYFHTRYQKAMKGGVVLCMMLESLAEGKAKLVKHKDGRMTMDMGDHEITLREEVQ